MLASGTIADSPWLDELDALRESIARALDELADTRMIHRLVDGDTAVAERIWSTARSLGWLAIGIPEDFGGLGLGLAGLACLSLELGRRVAPGPFVPTLVGAHWIGLNGPEPCREALLPGLAAGDIRIALPARSDQQPLELAAGALTGEAEMWGDPDSNLLLLPAISAGTGPCWAIVDGQSDAVEAAPLDIWDRTRTMTSVRCRNAAAMWIVDDADGVASAVLEHALLLALAADSMGGGHRIVELTIDYLKTRVQFDRPIGSFQAIKHRAADMAMRLSVGDGLLEQALDAEAFGVADAALWSAVAKAGCCDAYAFVAGDSVQLQGGVGHTWEFDAHLHVKRARMNQALWISSDASLDRAANALIAATKAQRSTADLT